MRGIVGAFAAAAVVVVLAGVVGAQEATPEAAALDAAVAAKVSKLISDGGYYYSVGQFDKALALADAALKLDPKSAAARQLKEISQEALAGREQTNWVKVQRKETQETLQEMKQEMVTQQELLRHGPNWPAVRQRTGGVYGPAAKINEENRAINAQLDAVKVTADFRATALGEVAAFLANLGKLNIQVDPRAKVGDKPAVEAEITFQAHDMKLRNALAWITRLNNLAYTVRDEAVLITDKEHLEEFKVTAVYDISDITAPIPDYASVPEFDITLPAVNARRINDGFYDVPYSWYWRGLGPFTGAYFVDFAEQPRYFMTEEEVGQLIDKLIEGEEQ